MFDRLKDWAMLSLPVIGFILALKLIFNFVKVPGVTPAVNAI